MGMREGNIDRVKRRLLAEAVAENLDVIHGIPPRGIRVKKRDAAYWLKRVPLLLVPITLVASTYVATSTPTPRESAASAAIGAPITPITRPAARHIEDPVERVAASAFPLAVRRIVLDAGHGGNDPGATSTAITEKEITLDIGRRLRTLLEQRGFEVISTRPDDRTVALRDRARLANESKSDIFVSIHVNALVSHVASRGVETYYLGATSDPSLTQLAAAENHGSGYSISDLRKLLDGIYEDAKRDESRELAQVVQERLHSGLRRDDPGLQNWGVKRAPFVVLVATEMPAILAEVGCISNEREVAMLRQPEYRQKIANALFDGIYTYASANDAPRQKGS